MSTSQVVNPHRDTSFPQVTVTAQTGISHIPNTKRLPGRDALAQLDHQLSKRGVVREHFFYLVYSIKNGGMVSSPKIAAYLYQRKGSKLLCEIHTYLARKSDVLMAALSLQVGDFYIEAGSDGFLTCLEILRLRVPADLVVLSACETAKGRIYLTEGIVGLTRAFMHAGTPRVLCSLWKVDDEATRALMGAFYERWNPDEGEGLPAAAALKRAQEFVRGHEKWEQPYYWAAWVLWGLPE